MFDAPRVARPATASRDGVVPWLVERVVSPLVRTRLREAWRGAEHIPARGGVIIAANHISYSDPLVLGRFLLVAANRFPHFLGKAEIFTVPVLGRLLVGAGQIPVFRGTARAADSFAAARRALVEGDLVVVLPEGTVTRDPSFWPMAGKSGAARLALTSGRPLVPVATWGPERILPPRGVTAATLTRAVLHRHEVTVAAGPAIDLDDLRNRDVTTETLVEATERLMSAITGLLEDIRGERTSIAPLANPRVVSTVRERRRDLLRPRRRERR